MKNFKERPQFKEFFRKVRYAYFSVFLFSFFSNLLTLSTPIAMMQIFQRVLPSQSTSTLIALFLVTALGITTQVLLDVMRNWSMSRVGLKLDRDFSAELFRCHMFDALERGKDKDPRTLKDLTQFRTFMSSSSLYSMMDSLWVPFFIAIFFFIHPALGMVMLAGASILVAMAILSEIMTRKPTQEAEEANNLATKEARASMQNAEVIAAMGMMPGILQSWEKLNLKARSLKVVATDRGAAISIVTRGVQMLVQLSVISVSALLIINHEIHPGAMVACMIMSSRVLAPVVMMISSWQNVIETRESYKRIKNFLLKTPPQMESMSLPEPTGRVTVEKLTYALQGRAKPIINRVDFEMNPGDIVGLIGPTASGKSTMARLLVGIYKPSLGAVRLDGADVYQWSKEELGKYIGYLPQDVELFSGTIGENISRMSASGDPQKIVEAARVAGVHDMILKLPRGYDTNIGSEGGMLSGGQKQRIALARALYGNPKFIVLDEPNANLDGEGEAALAQALIKAKAHGASTILISHRKEILKMVDKIVYLQHGRVAIAGPRDEVLKRMAAETKQSVHAPQANPAGASAAPVKKIVTEASSPLVKTAHTAAQNATVAS